MAVHPDRHQAASKQDAGNAATGHGAMLTSSVSAALQRYGTRGTSVDDAAAKTLLRALGMADLMERAAARRGKFSGTDLAMGSDTPAIDAEAIRALRVRLSFAAISHMHAGAIGSLGSASPQAGPDRALGSIVAELLGQAKQNQAAVLRGGDFRYDMDDVILKASRDPDLLSALQISSAAAEEARVKEAAKKNDEAKEVAAVRAAPPREARVPRTNERRANRRQPTRCEQLLAQIARFEGMRKTYRAQGFGSLVDWGIRVKKAEYNRGC